MTDAAIVRLGTDLRSGIVTEGRIENEPRGFLVTWIEWDSDFRRNLRSNESIVRDDTSPASVIEAMVQAIKTGDDKTWTSLFAPWKVMSGKGGRTIIDLSYSADASRFMSDWERSRRLIMGEVFDARVERVELVKRVLERSAENGLPNVDQVVVRVDHYGLFDGEYRTFQNVNVHRQWLLQRLDEGPWRITSIQGL
jgi:hypothetical protein